MTEVYASLIIKGIKQIEQVPEKIRNDVKQIVINKGFQELVERG